MTENREYHCEICGKEIPEDHDVSCNMCGASLCEECGTTGLCSTCAELWESEIDLEDTEAEEDLWYKAVVTYAISRKVDTGIPT